MNNLKYVHIAQRGHEYIQEHKQLDKPRKSIQDMKIEVNMEVEILEKKPLK